jgi:hypothetical protein
MNTPRHDIEIHQGVTFMLGLVYKDPNGEPVDLTGYSARMTVRDSEGGKVLCDLSSTAEHIRLGDTAPGAVNVEISDSITRKMPVTRLGVYDLLLFAPGGRSYKLMRGDSPVIYTATL